MTFKVLDNLVGGFNPWFHIFQRPSEKYESQLGFFFPIYGTRGNVPNHQPVKY